MESLPVPTKTKPRRHACPRCRVPLPLDEPLTHGEKSAAGSGKYVCYPCRRWERLTKPKPAATLSFASIEQRIYEQIGCDPYGHELLKISGSRAVPKEIVTPNWSFTEYEFTDAEAVIQEYVAWHKALPPDYGTSEVNWMVRESMCSRCKRGYTTDALVEIDGVNVCRGCLTHKEKTL